MYQFHVIIEESDYLYFNQYHLLKSPMGKRHLLYYRLMMPILCLFIVGIFYLAGADPLLIVFEGIAMGILAFIWVFFSKRIILKSLARKTAMMKKQGKLLYDREATMIFDKEFVQEITETMEMKVNYSKIHNLIVEEHGIYLYYGGMQAFILPFSTFSDAAQQEAFLSFLRSKISTEGESDKIRRDVS